MAPVESASQPDAGFVDRLWFGGRSWSETAREADEIFGFIWWVSVVSFVLLIGLTVAFMIIYRRRPGVPAARSAAHNTPLELAWSIIPLIIMFWMFFEGFRIYVRQQMAPTGGPTLNLTAQQWSWKLVYPNGAETDTYTTAYAPAGTDRTVTAASQPMPVFYVPEDTPILLRMISIDVIHSFWAPDFRMKQDIFPNRYTSYWFQADPLGAEALTMPARDDKHIERDYAYRDHIIFCAEYCGDLHSEMFAVLRVVKADVYEAKIAAWARPTGTLAERGQLVALRRGCVSCHTVDGGTSTGPTWKDLYGSTRQFTDGSTLTADDSYIRTSILTPGTKIVEGFTNQMTPYAGIVSEDEVRALTAYIGTLSAQTPQEKLEEFKTDPDNPEGAGGAEGAAGAAGEEGDQ